MTQLLSLASPPSCPFLCSTGEIEASVAVYKGEQGPGRQGRFHDGEDRVSGEPDEKEESAKDEVQSTGISGILSSWVVIFCHPAGRSPQTGI
jgi:hypothetical protein